MLDENPVRTLKTAYRKEKAGKVIRKNSNPKKWSSYKGLTVDTLAHRGDEGRSNRRNASGSWKQALIRRCPNGETQHTAR